MNLEQQVELREFLRSRRARLSPADVGLPDRRADRRRVPGLRREELAKLAAWHPEAYRRFEQERLPNVTEEMLERLAEALRLGEDDREQLFALALDAPVQEPLVPPPPQPQKVRTGVMHVLKAVMPAPAYIRGRRTDIIAHNPAAASLLALGRRRTPNLTRAMFTEAAVEMFEDWERAAADAVTALRQDVVRYPDDPHTATLVGELSVLHPDFRQMWLDDDEELPPSHGEQVVHHPDVGTLELRWEALRVDGDRDQTLVAYTAAPGSRSAMALRVLAELTANPLDPL